MKKWTATAALLKALQALEAKNKALIHQGVTLSTIPDMQHELLEAIFEINSIDREHPAADWFLYPALQLMWGEVEINACLKLMQERYAELRLKNEREVG